MVDMDYAFYRVTKHKPDMKYTENDCLWLPLDRLVSVEPNETGSTITYFNGTGTVDVTIRETAEGIFNSVVFVKSPTTYYVDPSNPTMDTI
tara:strand:+ start:754 stop:1026 length:273 start_codon:yes stop_codon:yes gene_type:complete